MADTDDEEDIDLEEITDAAVVSVMGDADPEPDARYDASHDDVVMTGMATNGSDD